MILTQTRHFFSLTRKTSKLPHTLDLCNRGKWVALARDSRSKKYKPSGGDEPKNDDSCNDDDVFASKSVENCLPCLSNVVSNVSTNTNTKTNTRMSPPKNSIVVNLSSQELTKGESSRKGSECLPWGNEPSRRGLLGNVSLPNGRFMAYK